MKVLQFLGSQGWGGLESVFVTQSNELAKRIHVDVLIFKESSVVEKFDKCVNIHILNSNPSRYNPLLFIEIYKLIVKLQPDIVHTHGAKSTQMFYYLNKLLHISHVATKHNVRKGKIFNKVENVIAVSKKVRETVLKTNVEVVYNGIKPIHVDDKSKQDKIFTIIAVGRLDKIKGFDILVKECVKLNFRFQVYIVGEGKEKENLKNLINNLGLKDKIILLGFRKDIAQLMHNADLVVMTSYSEGFSLVMVESFFYANLFVSTKVSGAIEILEDRFLFDGFNFSKKLNDIYQNYDNYKKEFNVFTNKTKDKFLLSHVIDETLRIYKEIIHLKNFNIQTCDERDKETGMNILMVSLDYPPTVGGISAHVYELGQALKHIGCNVSIATKCLHKDQKEFETLEGVDVHRFDLKFIGCTYGRQINDFVEKLIRKKHFDIIHIHGMRPLEFYKIKEIPLVYTNHTSGYLKRIKKGGYRIPLLKRLFSKPKLFLAPSEELLEIPFDIPAKKVFISNGVISDKFTRNEKVRNKLRSTLGIKNDEILAIITRRMVWKNGVKYLAQSTKYIQNNKVKFLFIGDGEDFNEVEQILEENFKNRFMLLGSKKHQEIIAYYSAADLSILPSLMEATSISGLEAMAASLPLVGTRVGGIPVLIKDGVNGYLCEPEDPKDLAEKIDKLLDNDFVKMGNKSKKFVDQNFDWIKIAEHTLQEYNELLNVKGDQ